jgi:hypothetical protein
MVTLSAPPARAQISVRPAIIELGAGGTASSEEVLVINEGKETIQLRFYIGDFDQSESGDHIFSRPGTHPQSCADRLAIFPDGATMSAGARQAIRVEMLPGTSTCWSVLFVEHLMTGAIGVQIGQRVAVKLYGLADASPREGEITGIRVRSGGDGLEAVITFRNLGSTPVRPDGRLEIRSLTGEVLHQVAIKHFSVLPGRIRQVTIPIGAILPAGQFLAVPVLDLDAGYLVGGQLVFTIADR